MMVVDCLVKKTGRQRPHANILDIVLRQTGGDDFVPLEFEYAGIELPTNIIHALQSRGCGTTTKWGAGYES